jgi:hypothetical protein
MDDDIDDTIDDILVDSDDTPSLIEPGCPP